jgi:hypothetical protein
MQLMLSMEPDLFFILALRNPLCLIWHWYTTTVAL